MFFFSKKKLLLNSAQTCFIPNYAVIRIKPDKISVPLATRSHQRQFGTYVTTHSLN